MNQSTILIIDDSATIRRLADRTLTALGYCVLAAGTAEDGLARLESSQPDLILLDHQLPGTTGTEVAKQVLQIPEARHIPIVVSSTLRKRAYAEYMELPNVVDLLPKPYTEELLTTTVENALQTADMVVSSQTDGTAVPEVIQQANEPNLSGKCDDFSAREVLDFLTHGEKSGVLEFESSGYRVFVYLANGRIAGVSSSGLPATLLTDSLPAALENLAPVAQLTFGGRGSTELEGIVELLNRKVLDPRLLKQLLRHQASQLLWKCFTESPKEFRFVRSTTLPPLFEKLPVNVSVVALLIEAALSGDPHEVPPEEPLTRYVRSKHRGHSSDRAGLAAQHMKLLTMLAEPRSIADIAGGLSMSKTDAQRILCALQHAGFIEQQIVQVQPVVLAYESNPTAACAWIELFSECEAIDGRVVRDRFSFQLLSGRIQPTAYLFAYASEDAVALAVEVSNAEPDGEHVVKMFLLPGGSDMAVAHERLQSLGLRRFELLEESATDLGGRLAERLQSVAPADREAEHAVSSVSTENPDQQPLLCSP